jgi:hypothetical protein
VRKGWRVINWLPLTVDFKYCWNLIKASLAPSMSPRFYGYTGQVGLSNMVSEPGGLEFESRPRIFRCA